MAVLRGGGGGGGAESAHPMCLLSKRPHLEYGQAWCQYSCNGPKHPCKLVSDSALSNFDTREHLDYNIGRTATF